MNKDQLQKELLEKVKVGIKPSDLKKNQGKKVETISTPPLPKEQKKPNLKTQQLEQENQLLREKLARMENQSQKRANQEQVKQESLFTCHSCQLEWSTEFLQLKTPQGQLYCSECVDKMTQATNQTKPQPTSFTCEFCHKSKQEKPHYCHVKNMPDQRDSREISKLCSYCSYARAKKENFYCPRFSSGRDVWDISIPEFDCYCPQK